MTATNAYAIRGRLAKLQRYVHVFDDVARKAGGDPTSRATAEEIVRQLTAATDAQWLQVAESMHEKGPPSRETRDLIVAHYRTIVKRFTEAQSDWEEILEGLHEQRKAVIDGDLR